MSGNLLNITLPVS